MFRFCKPVPAVASYRKSTQVPVEICGSGEYGKKQVYRVSRNTYIRYYKYCVEGREVSYGKIGLTTVAVTQDLLSGMPLFLRIELIRLWNSILPEPYEAVNIKLIGIRFAVQCRIYPGVTFGLLTILLRF